MKFDWAKINGGASRARAVFVGRVFNPTRRLAKPTYEYIRKVGGVAQDWLFASYLGFPRWLWSLTAILAILVFIFVEWTAEQIPGSRTRDRAAEPGLWLEWGKNIAAGIGGVVALWALYFTHRHREQTDLELKQAAERNLNERFSKAVEMLGAMREAVRSNQSKVFRPSLEIRLGGLYALERLANDSRKDRPTVIKILCAYVRENAKWNDRKATDTDLWIKAWKAQKKRQNSCGLADFLQASPRIDVQTALTILGSDVWGRASASEEEMDLPRVQLGRADLRHAWLAGGQFQGAFLGWAHLEAASMTNADFGDAYLTAAHLEGANLSDACLGGAHLEDANLFGANLERAHLGGARLRGACLSNAQLEGANLRVADLHHVQLENADLRGSHLEHARLFGAQLQGADLRGAHLESADLIGADGLTQQQIEEAFGNGDTKLPTEPDPSTGRALTRPDHWVKASSDSGSKSRDQAEGGPASGEGSPERGAESPDSEAQVPGSETQVPGSEEESPSRETQVPGSEIQSPGSEIRPPGSEIRPPGSEIRPPGSETRSPSPKIEVPKPKKAPRKEKNAAPKPKKKRHKPN